MRVMSRRNRLYLARHGQVQGFERSPIYGRTDVEITDVGRTQMEALSERLRHVRIDAVYASDLQRAFLGAQIVGRHHNIPIVKVPGLREMDFGAWEGLTVAEVQERFPDELQEREKDLLGYRMPGGGESLEAFSRRVLSSLRDIYDERKGEDILLVAHGMVNRVILCEAMGLDLSMLFRLHQDYGCLNIIDTFSDTGLVRLVNG
jgi:alpha-ribazole phosphatase/probable phosphoglycerate mutase